MILPADIYIVINKGFITEVDRKLIIDLYQPIIGNNACSLYYTLLNDLEYNDIVSGSYSHHHIQSVMHLSLEEIDDAKKLLEAIGLLKTYLKKGNINTYVYQLYNPISAHEFLNSPILNVVLYNNVGKDEYDKIVEHYKIPRINLKDYEDITHSFNDVFKSVSSNPLLQNYDLRVAEKNVLNLNHKFDFALLIEGIDKNMISDKCFTKEIKSLILNLSYIYNIDALAMQSIVKASLNDKGLIDKDDLRKNSRNYYQFEHDGNLPTLIYNTQPEFLKKPQGDSSKRAMMIYTFENVSPYQFIKSKYKDGKVTARDLKIIEDLLLDLKLYPGVINVLLDYTLKINNQKLNKSYIETIAGQWKRLGIESVEEAMNVCEKEYHKKNKTNIRNSSISKKETKVPDWFDKDIAKEEISKDIKDELEHIISEFD